MLLLADIAFLWLPNPDEWEPSTLVQLLPANELALMNETNRPSLDLILFVVFLLLYFFFLLVFSLILFLLTEANRQWFDGDDGFTNAPKACAAPSAAEQRDARGVRIVSEKRCTTSNPLSRMVSKRQKQGHVMPDSC